MSISKIFSEMRNDINKAQKVLEDRTINRHENNATQIADVNVKVAEDEDGTIEIASAVSDEADATTEIAEMLSDLMDAVTELGEILAE